MAIIITMAAVASTTATANISPAIIHLHLIACSKKKANDKSML